MYRGMPKKCDKLQVEIMKKNIPAIIIFAISVASLSYIMVATHVYGDVKEKMVSVPCLSCIKMDPKTTLNFRFETANGENFPVFILENLSRGPIFLHFRVDICTACDEMDQVIGEIFDLDDMDEPFIVKSKNFSGVKITLIHVNLDHADEIFKEIYKTFDISGQGVVPMYTIITIGYDRGVVKPCYATGYGFLGKSGPAEAKKVLICLIEDAVELYRMNIKGYT